LDVDSDGEVVVTLAANSLNDWDLMFMAIANTSATVISIDEGACVVVVLPLGSVRSVDAPYHDIVDFDRIFIDGHRLISVAVTGMVSHDNNDDVTRVPLLLVNERLSTGHTTGGSAVAMGKVGGGSENDTSITPFTFG
jgi:hypothetical protein